jgi:hypothetical protein
MVVRRKKKSQADGSIQWSKIKYFLMSDIIGQASKFFAD